jgi:hypothetical protein
MTISAECPVEAEQRRFSPRAEDAFPRRDRTPLENERMVRVQQICERVGARAYHADPEKVAGAIIERLVARPGGRPVGDHPQS